MEFVVKIIGVYLLACVVCVALLFALLMASAGFAFALPIFAPLVYVPVLILHALQLHIVVAAITRKIAIRWLALPVAVYAIAGALALLSLRAERDIVVEIEAENVRKVAIPSLPLVFTQASYLAPTLVRLYDVPAVFGTVLRNRERITVVYTYQQGEGCHGVPDYRRDNRRRDLPLEKRPCVVETRADRPASVVLLDRRDESFHRYLTSARLKVDTISIVDATGVRPLLRLHGGSVSRVNPLWFEVPHLRVKLVGSHEVEALAAALSLRPRL